MSAHDTERPSSGGLDTELHGVAVYALRGTEPAARNTLDCLQAGPVPFIEQAEGPGSDERSDRSRALPPHIAGLVLDDRKHAHVLALAKSSEAERALRTLAHEGITVDWIEVVDFASEADAVTLEEIVTEAGGDVPRGEVTTCLGVAHFAIANERGVRGLTSRGEQGLHEAMWALLAPLGAARRERTGDLMDASELPFVACFAIGHNEEAACEEACRVLGRNSERTLTNTGGWSAAFWPDAIAIGAERDDGPGYRLRKRTMAVALSVVLDGVLMRLAQRHTLEMLARRVAGGRSVEPKSISALHASALRLRARVWWPHISLEPFVEDISCGLTEAWALASLAQSVFDELGALAQQAQLRADERLGRLLLVLTVGSLGIAFTALVVEIATNSRSSTAVLAALGSALVGVVSAAVIFLRTRFR